jgi:two-component system, chemotaxis family, protein-glutamate methylesterase/glutaminase
MNPIRVLVVDDSATVRRILRILISEDPELELAGVAANGRIALAVMEQVVPDLVTLDLEMPEMDGLAALRHLRRERPHLPVVVFSSATTRGAIATLEALAQGATDYVTKPAGAMATDEAFNCIRQQLLPKVKALCTRRNRHRLHARVSRTNTGETNHDALVEIVAIGTSTGGPNALAEVLSVLPRDLPVPLVIAQHMPALFTHFLAERLAAVCVLPVREAKGGERLLPGTVWLAPGGVHLAVWRRAGIARLQLLAEPAEHACRPSVDVLFRSLADSFGASVLAVVMTGMGRDGLQGAREICTAGGRVWAQDATTSVVWGMPGLVVEDGLAERVLPLPMIGSQLVQAIGAGRPSDSSWTATGERSHEDVACDFRVPGASGI